MSLRVLVFEHEPILAIELETILADAGCSVVGFVNNMQAALAVAAREAVDVAIVDLLLSPRCPGVETARRLYEDYRVRSLFVSLHAGRRDDAMQTDLQSVGFVLKPYVDSEIVRHLAPMR